MVNGWCWWLEDVQRGGDAHVEVRRRIVGLEVERAAVGVARLQPAVQALELARSKPMQRWGAWSLRTTTARSTEPG